MLQPLKLRGSLRYRFATRRANDLYRSVHAYARRKQYACGYQPGPSDTLAAMYCDTPAFFKYRSEIAE